jgi:hypothetical protein
MKFYIVETQDECVSLYFANDVYDCLGIAGIDGMVTSRFAGGKREVRSIKNDHLCFIDEYDINRGFVDSFVVD